MTNGRKYGKFGKVLAWGLLLTLLLGGCGNVDVDAGTRQNGKRGGGSSRESGESESSRESRESTESGESSRESRESTESSREDSRESRESGENSRESRESGEDSRESRESTESSREGEEAAEEGSRENTDTSDSKQVRFGSVPYFKDDSGSNTQLADGWLYGYWSRQLCRINVETLESEVLFEANSPQEGYFSIYDGMIYFVEQRNVSYLDGAKANLWRMACDGSRQELLAEDFVIGDGYEIGESALTDMEIFDDIVYLLTWNPDEVENKYFRLKEDGSAEEIPEEETLYGMVPEGFQEARCVGYTYRGLRNLVYCVRNFGYAFICDEDEDLYRIILETGEKEFIPVKNVGSMGGLTLTNEALIYRNAEKWYAISLDNPQEVREIGVLDCYSMTFWDDKGIYDIERNYGGDNFSVMRLNWNGERKTIDYWVQNPRLESSVYGDSLKVLYSDGDYLYYDNLLEGDGVICRIALEKDDPLAYDDEAERVFVYYENPMKGVAAEETVSFTFTAEATGARAEFSMTRVYLLGKSKADLKTNAYLEEIYKSEEDYNAQLMDEVRNATLEDLLGADLKMVENDLNMYVTFLDENYIGCSAYWYECWSGAAHGMHGCTEYVFSRSSGERVLLTDVLENSPEEICAIIAPYVEAKAEWGTDEEGWEQIILDEGRFYLTTEGIGIRFDAYELTCYASGGLNVVVPYELFDMPSHS